MSIGSTVFVAFMVGLAVSLLLGLVGRWLQRRRARRHHDAVMRLLDQIEARHQEQMKIWDQS